MPFSEFNVKHLFPTPFITASFAPDMASEINSNLTPVILKKAEESDGVHLSNMGGWQSESNLQKWGGKPIEIIIDALCNLIEQVTYDVYAQGSEFSSDWKIYAWANINRNGDYNVVHSHPGCFWSATYYVQTEDVALGQPTGGEFEMIDPRGVLPTTYCPRLRYRIKGYRSCGGFELHVPKAGECVLFPSWLPHSVRKYTGIGTRISLAFNFCI